MKKRLVSLVLVFVMVLTIVPSIAFAKESSNWEKLSLAFSGAEQGTVNIIVKKTRRIFPSCLFCLMNNSQKFGVVILSCGAQDRITQTNGTVGNGLDRSERVESGVNVSAYADGIEKEETDCHVANAPRNDVFLFRPGLFGNGIIDA